MQLMELQGSIETYEVVMDQMLDQMRSQFGEEAQDFFTEFENELKKDGFNAIMELTVETYRKHFTEAELDGIIAFYETDAGKALAQKTPALTQDLYTAGSKWGEDLAKTIIDRMQNTVHN